MILRAAIALIFSAMFASCSTINRDNLVFASGAATSIATHWVSHAAYVEANDISWYQDGLVERLDQEVTERERGMIGRSGIVGQLIVGYILKYGPWSDGFKKGQFMKGYATFATMQIAGSAAIDNGDYKFMRRSGEETAITKWLYSGASLYLLKGETWK